MSTHLVNKITKCGNNRRAGARAHATPCGHDYCCHCSLPRTNLICDSAVFKFATSNSFLYSSTAYIGPVKSVDQGHAISLKLLHEIAKDEDAKLAGSVEFSDPKYTPGFDKFHAAKPFIKTLHFAFCHWHFISDQYFNKESVIGGMFKLPNQLEQRRERSRKKFVEQTRIDFVRKTMAYPRKRRGIMTEDWFNSIKECDQQLTFLVEYGVLSVWDFRSNSWVISSDLG